MKKTKAAILKEMKAYSPFQQSVWKACLSIPRGQTRTYKWIAEKIGRPGASRAVGTALGQNPFAPVVPCHRVISSNGALGGYSGKGGLKTKLSLLRKERALK